MLENAGLIALSLRGHDRGKLFLVLERTANAVLLADGKSRTLENPKLKNLRHVRFLPVCSSHLLRSEPLHRLTNADIRRILAATRAGISRQG